MTEIPVQPIEDTSGIIRAYALMILGFPMIFVPMSIIAGLGFFMTIGGLIYILNLQSKLAHTVLGKNHVQWMLRTFWIAAFYCAIGALVTWMIVTSNADTAQITQMATELQNGTATSDGVKMHIDTFQTKNATLIHWTKILCFAPCLIFFVLRFVKGYRLAEGYKIVPNAKTWLI